MVLICEWIGAKQTNNVNTSTIIKLGTSYFKNIGILQLKILDL